MLFVARQVGDGARGLVGWLAGHLPSLPASVWYRRALGRRPVRAWSWGLAY
jgi:hypothetical protein